MMALPVMANQMLHGVNHLSRTPATMQLNTSFAQNSSDNSTDNFAFDLIDRFLALAKSFDNFKRLSTFHAVVMGDTK